MSALRQGALGRQRGFSLIELMVALLLSLFLVGGVVSVFMANSATSKVQQSLARMLENGRYASQFMSDELRMTGAQYCAQYATALPTATGMNPLKPIYMNSNVTSNWPKWWPANPTASRYPVDPGVFLRGYDCDKTSGTCTPALPSSADVNIVPPVGVTGASRAKGTDVLTIRYLNSTGVPITTNAGGPTPIDISPQVPTAAPLNFGANDLAMIADCGNAEIFSQSIVGNTLTHIAPTSNYLGNLVGAFARDTDSRIFNFTRDFISVTYYVGFVDDPDVAGRLIPTLMRMVNGVTQPVVLGVERFDVTYAVADGKQDLHYLRADELNGAVTLQCPPIQADLAVLGTSGSCLWRAVQGIEVSMLFDSVRDDGPGNDPFRYSPDSTAVQTYAPTDTLPIGISAGRMMRREFRFFASVHNFSR